MKLLTNELLARFKEVGSQENNPDPLIIAKFFNPVGAGNWLASEYDPESRIFFGYVSIFNEEGMNEWGSFSLDELESFKDERFGLGIERARYWNEEPISKVKERFGIV